MTGNELRVLRALRRGPIYRGALGLMAPVEQRKAEVAARSCVRQGYAVYDAEEQTFSLTAKGEEVVEAMTP